jgi:hypothetical protein
MNMFEQMVAVLKTYEGENPCRRIPTQKEYYENLKQNKQAKGKKFTTEASHKMMDYS